MTVEEYAAIAGVSVQTARRHCRQGKVPAELLYQPRRHWNIIATPEEVREILATARDDKNDKAEDLSGAISSKDNDKDTTAQLGPSCTEDTLQESEKAPPHEPEAGTGEGPPTVPGIPESWQGFTENPRAAEGAEPATEATSQAGGGAEEARQIYLLIVKRVLPAEYESGKPLWEIWADAMARKFPVGGEEYDWLCIIGVPALMCKDKIAGILANVRGRNA